MINLHRYFKCWENIYWYRRNLYHVWIREDFAFLVHRNFETGNKHKTAISSVSNVSWGTVQGHCLYIGAPLWGKIFFEFTILKLYLMCTCVSTKYSLNIPLLRDSGTSQKSVETARTNSQSKTIIMKTAAHLKTRMLL